MTHFHIVIESPWSGSDDELPSKTTDPPEACSVLGDARIDAVGGWLSVPVFTLIVNVFLREPEVALTVMSAIAFALVTCRVSRAFPLPSVLTPAFPEASPGTDAEKITVTPDCGTPSLFSRVATRATSCAEAGWFGSKVRLSGFTMRPIVQSVPAVSGEFTQPADISNSAAPRAARAALLVALIVVTSRDALPGAPSEFRIRPTVERRPFGAGAHVRDPRLLGDVRLVHLRGDRHPGLRALRERVFRERRQVMVADEGLEIRRVLSLVGEVLVDQRPHRVQVLLQRRLLRLDDAALVVRDRRGRQDPDDRDHHDQLDERES